MATTLTTRIGKLEKTIDGNGEDGLRTRVRLLEKTMNEIVWWVRSIGIAVILYVVNSLLKLI